MLGELPDLPRAPVADTELAYFERGTGPQVVLVHGSASDIRTWRPQLQALADHHRTIAYSRRYAPPNDPIPPGVDDQMQPHVDDLATFLQSVDATPAHIVGHSWGGFIALLFAIQHPRAVRSLVVMEPPVLSLFVSSPPRPTELLRVFLRRPATAAAIVRFGATAFAPAIKAFDRGDDAAGLRAFGRGVLGRRQFAEMPPERRQQAHDNMATVRAQLLGAGFPPLTDAMVRGVKMPMLLITGADSPPLLHRLTAHLQALLPQAERTVIPAASHVMNEDNPTAVNAALLDFLARQR